MTKNTHAPGVRTMPNASDFWLSLEDSDAIHWAKTQLTRLNDGIADCKEQLAII